jgi:hypothetical protein
MAEQKSHRVDFKEGGFQYLLLDADEAKAWRKLDSVAKVTAEEPPSTEPPTAELGAVVDAKRAQAVAEGSES